jgi:hypothetical protein
MWPVQKSVSRRTSLDGRGGDVQWKNHTPGLSATKRSVTECMDGTCTVSLRIGLRCPSTKGGFSVSFVDV